MVGTIFKTMAMDPETTSRPPYARLKAVFPAVVKAVPFLAAVAALLVYFGFSRSNPDIYFRKFSAVKVVPDNIEPNVAREARIGFIIDLVNRSSTRTEVITGLSYGGGSIGITGGHDGGGLLLRLAIFDSPTIVAGDYSVEPGEHKRIAFLFPGFIKELAYGYGPDVRFTGEWKLKLADGEVRLVAAYEEVGLIEKTQWQNFVKNPDQPPILMRAASNEPNPWGYQLE